MLKTSLALSILNIAVDGVIPFALYPSSFAILTMFS